MDDRADELEARLARCRRLETVGQIAGAAVGDLNNLLAAIADHASLVEDSLPAGIRARSDLEQIRRAAERGTRLTQRIACFSSPEIRHEPVELDALVDEAEDLLRGALGGRVGCRVRRGAPGALVAADPAEIEQLLLNLARNAREAMPAGGMLTITTSVAEPVDADHPPHVILTVADDGVGMPRAVAGRACEPFFTTKPRDGAGLGLASVYATVARARGRIEIDSEEGRGTVVSVRLPVVPDDEEIPTAPDRDERATVLLVEDEDDVRAVARRILARDGYVVIEARDGLEALEQYERHVGPIDLVLTDVVMPGMSGAELAVRLRGRQRELPVIYMSGYLDEVVRHGLAEARTFLQKPFTAEELRQRVREATGDPARHEPPGHSPFQT